MLNKMKLAKTITVAHLHQIRPMKSSTFETGLRFFSDFVSDTSAKPAKRPKCAKGYHVSKNAYTLVYTLQGQQDDGRKDY